MEGLQNDECKDCKSYLDYVTIKDNQLIFRCFSCKKNYGKDFNKELIQKFANIYEFCNGDLNNFILLLRKRVYPYEYMDNWERFNEILLPNKEAFYSNLNMEDITDTDYRHANKAFKEFKIKQLGEYHDLNVQSEKEQKKAKGTKKCAIKRELKFNDYKDCLLNDKVVLKSYQRFKSERHNVYTENVNKIALSSNYDKRLLTFDKITTYPYGYKGKNVKEIC